MVIYGALEVPSTYLITENLSHADILKEKRRLNQINFVAKLTYWSLDDNLLR